MNCPAYNTPYCRSDGQPCTKVVDCRHGWLPFWTPAERAGIRAMGEWYRFWKNLQHRDEKKESRAYHVGQLHGVETAIQRFVEYARKAKEGK